MEGPFVQMCVADGESGDDGGGGGFVKKCCPEGEIILPDMDTCVRVSHFGGQHLCGTEHIGYSAVGYSVNFLPPIFGPIC